MKTQLGSATERNGRGLLDGEQLRERTALRLVQELEGWLVRPRQAALCLVLAVTGSLAAPSLAESADIMWQSPVSGDWSEGANWSGGMAPGPSDTAVIDVDGTYTVTVDTSPTLLGISLGGGSGTQTLTVSGQTVSVSSLLAIEANGSFDLQNSDLVGAGSVENRGTVRLLGAGTISISVEQNGMLIASGAGNELAGAFVPLSGSTTRVDPQPALSNSELIIANGFINLGEIELIQNTSGVRDAKLTVTSGSLTNGGTGVLRSLRGTHSQGTRTLDLELLNEGLLQVEHPLTMIRGDADHVNSGSVVVTNIGTLSLTQSGVTPSFSNSGTIQIDLNRLFTIAGGTFYHDPGTTSGAGTLRCEGVDLVGVTHSSGGARFLLAGNNTVDVMANAGMLITSGPANVITNYTASTGSITQVDSQPTLSNSQLTVENGFTNFGDIEITQNTSGVRDSKFSITSGVLTNAPGAKIHSFRGTHSQGTRTLDIELVNEGELNVEHPLILSRPDADHSNSGSIVVQNIGTLTLPQTGVSPTFTNTGTIQIDAGRLFTLIGGAFNHDPGTTSGDGTLRCEGVSLAGVTHSVSGATLLLAGNNTVDTMGNSGALICSGGSNVITTYANQAGSLTRVDSQPTLSNSLLTVTNGFTNFGDIELTQNTSGVRDSKFSITTGLLTNAAAGTIRSMRGTHSQGTRTLDVELVNEGTLNVEHPLTLDRAEAQHANTNSIIVQNIGTLTLPQTGISPTFTNTGTIQVDAGRMFTLVGGVFNHDPGMITGDGTFRCEGVSLIGVTHPSDGATLLLAANNSVDTMVNGGPLVCSGPGNLITDFSNSIGSLTRVDPQPTLSNSTLTITNGFTNLGDIELTQNTSGVRDARLVVTNGSLTNGPSAKIQSLRGTHTQGTRTLDLVLENEGELNVEHPLSIVRNNADHTNAGFFIVRNFGSLYLAQTGASPSISNSGVIQIDGGRLFTINGGDFFHDPGTTTGLGTLRCEGVSLFGVTHAAGGVSLLLAANNTVDTMSNSGPLICSGPDNVITNYTSFAGSLVRVDPQPTLSNSVLTVTNGFTNLGDIELTQNTSGVRDALLSVANGVFTNGANGKIHSLRGTHSQGTRTLDAVLKNEGLLSVEHPLTINRESADHTNSGSIVVKNIGTLTLLQAGTTPSFSNTGTIQVDSARLMTILGGSFNHDPGTTDGEGTLRCEGVDIHSVTHGEDSVVLLLAANNTVDTMTNAGALICSGANNSIADLTTMVGSTIRVDPQPTLSNSTLTVANGFTNLGDIELVQNTSGVRDARFSVTNGFLVNAAGAGILSLRGTHSQGTRTLDLELNNRGTVDIQHPLVLGRPDARHRSSGLIELSSIGTFYLAQSGSEPSFSNTGSIEIGAGRTFTIAGGSFNHDPGTTSGDGTLRCEGVELARVTHRADGAVLLLAANNTVDAMTNSGRLICSGANNIISEYITAAGSLTRVDPQPTLSNSSLLVETGFTNFGNIELIQNTSGVRDAQLSVAGGTLVNAPDATIESLRGTHSQGTRTLDAALDNQGELRVEHPLVALTGPYHNLSGGLITGNRTADFSAVIFTDDGVISPGLSPGTLTLLGDDPRSETSALNVELGGTGHGTQYDRIAISGSALVDGAINISYVDGFQPALGDSFAILTAGVRAGTFDFATGLTTPNGLQLEVSYKEDRIDLLAGDAIPNDPPTAVADTVMTGEDFEIEIDVLANDYDPDEDILSIVPGTISNPPHGFATLTDDQTILYVPDLNYFGPDSFTYIISDQVGGDDSGIVRIDVVPLNDPPTYAPVTLSGETTFVISPDELVDFRIVASDVDSGDVVILTSTELPEGAILGPPLPLGGNPVESLFLWTPTEEQEGVHEITFFATDDSLAVTELLVTIEVENPTSSGPGDEIEVVQLFQLSQVSPNPSHGDFVINYAVPRSSQVQLDLFDVQGRVVDRLYRGEVAPGRHSLTYNGMSGRGQRIAAGVYFVKLATGGKSLVRRIVVTR